MLSWGARRKYIILSIISGAFLLVVFVYAFSVFYKPASCFDGKLNQNEVGVDCGGNCARLCENQIPNLTVHWKRYFYVTEGAYNAVAYIENTNPRSGSEKVDYVFKLYDDENILVSERVGSATIPPQRTVPIFEGNIRTGHRFPFRIEFEFEGAPEWISVPYGSPVVRVINQEIKDLDTFPLLTATLSNQSEISLSNVEVVVIIYDTDNNARAASKTVADFISESGSAPLLFSWPAPFGFVPGRIEIVPRVYPGLNY